MTLINLLYILDARIFYLDCVLSVQKTAALIESTILEAAAMQPGMSEGEILNFFLKNDSPGRLESLQSGGVVTALSQ